MAMTIPYTEQLSEAWLLERTYHAYMHHGEALSVLDFTQAMKAITNLYVPFSLWEEITPEEAATTYQQGRPVLLYSEHPWKHLQKGPGAWRASKNMYALIFGNAPTHSEAETGAEHGVCYLDRQRGNASNDSWSRWFSTDPAMLLAGSASSPITFLGPRWSFPSTTHYTVIAPDGHSVEYADPTAAIQGFEALPPEEIGKGSNLQVVFPQLCYYYDVTCPDGTYRLEFFGPRMQERGYWIKGL